jgi:hypothetical protein
VFENGNVMDGKNKITGQLFVVKLLRFGLRSRLAMRVAALASAASLPFSLSLSLSLSL